MYLTERIHKKTNVSYINEYITINVSYINIHNKTNVSYINEYITRPYEYIKRPIYLT